MDSEVLIITTVYPGNKNYLRDFFNLLKKQDDNNFDVLIINENFDFRELRDLTKNLNLIIINTNEKSPAKNRELAIKKAIELARYKYFIFGDSDDFFSKDRVSITKKMLKKHKIVVNDIVPFESSSKIKKKPLFSKIHKIGKIKASELFDCNIAGLSNTAIRSELLKFPIKFTNDTIAVDWLFFSQVAFYNNVDIYFTNSTLTYYRQYENNTIGFTSIINYEKIEKIINVKINHYTNMIEFCHYHKLLKEEILFKEKLNEMKELQNYLDSPVKRHLYLEYINKYHHKIYKGWWSEAIPLKIFRSNYGSSINKK